MRDLKINSPKAQAFVADLVALCRKHGVIIAGAAGYSLELRTTDPERPVHGMSTDRTTFYQEPGEETQFDLEWAQTP